MDNAIGFLGVGLCVIGLLAWVEYITSRWSGKRLPPAKHTWPRR